MLKKIRLATLGLFTSVLAFSQSGAIKVKLIDNSNGESIPFANVIVETGGSQAGAGTTNIDGEVTIKPLNPGKYNVKATYVGYQVVQITGITVSNDKTSYVDIKMSNTAQNLAVVDIVAYSEPLIDPDTKSGSTITREEYQNMPSRNINTVAATSAGVYQKDDGGSLNVRGARSSSNDYYIDGVRVLGGAAGLPQQSIEQITVITGGVPAQYGDATGGIISITTRGPQSKFFGSVEASTSGIPKGLSNDKSTSKDRYFGDNESVGLDKFGYNYFGFTLGGPIISKRDTASSSKRAVLGYIVSGEARYELDPNPSAIGSYRISAEKLKELEETPLELTARGIQKTADYVTASDLQKIDAKQNVAAKGFSLSGKVDYKPSNNINITLGGSVDYVRKHDFIDQYAIFNAANNPESTDKTWRTYLRLQQKFGNSTAAEEEKSASIIKNAFYNIQIGYNKKNFLRQDDTHKDKFFRYGHVGTFNQYRERNYSYLDSLQLPDSSWVKGVFAQDSYRDTYMTFTPSSYNPNAANWTSTFYDIYENELGGTVQNYLTLQQYKALPNGDRSENVQSVWLSTGREYPQYQKTDNSQITINTSFSADIKNHQVTAGFYYEQRDDRSYTLVPINLWGLARQYANNHLILDTDNPIENTELSASGTLFYDYNYELSQTDQKAFDKNLRIALGLDPNGTDWLDVDSYSPDFLSVDMFSADDLFNLSGNSSVAYRGFDHTGKRIKGNPTFDDFLTKKDADGNYTRLIPAYRPIYVAGYVSDRFDIKGLKFNVGLRIDRFDANQKVLKDKYSFYEVKTAGETDFSKFAYDTRPSNIGDDYVVYVDKEKDPTNIKGYRNGDKWYNSEGVEVADPSVLESNGRVIPYLVDPDYNAPGRESKGLSSKAFKDYEAQLNFNPRIGFAFDITDQAEFFAHYDILTERPPVGNAFDPTDYLFNNVSFISNPALKPQRTTDYEFGFTQVINERKSAAIKLSAFYKEFRDLIQTVRVYDAYPSTYDTYGNIDFGTSKGFTAEFQLRRTQNVTMTATYTLSFSEGSGSSAESGYNLVFANQPNLRVIMPLDYDQRHTLVTNIDFRYGSDKDYNGPVITLRKGKDNEKRIKVLENAGANLLLNIGSGTPYTKAVGPTALPGGGRAAGILGTPNGSSLPWTYRVDLRLDRDFGIKWGKKDDESAKKSNLNVYLQVLNLLNIKNVNSVYAFTGNPDDDGWLTSPLGIQTTNNIITSPTSYVDLYSAFMENPSNYSIPRRIRIGAVLEF